MNKAIGITGTEKANMSEMEYKQKKNQMLNYFVDRRKKKKPTAMQKAKQKVLDRTKGEENEAEGEGEEEKDEIDL